MFTGTLPRVLSAVFGNSNKKRFTVCLRESSFTALQQGDIYDLLRVSFPRADQSSHYKTTLIKFCTLCSELQTDAAPMFCGF